MWALLSPPALREPGLERELVHVTYSVAAAVLATAVREYVAVLALVHKLQLASLRERCSRMMDGRSILACSCLCGGVTKARTDLAGSYWFRNSFASYHPHRTLRKGVWLSSHDLNQVL